MEITSEFKKQIIVVYLQTLCLKMKTKTNKKEYIHLIQPLPLIFTFHSIKIIAQRQEAQRIQKEQQLIAKQQQILNSQPFASDVEVYL